jgi:phosphoesterase RecJ-like protein
VTKKNTPLEQASQFIQASHYPLLICHVSPDSDAIGSMMGLSFALQHLGHSPISACSDPIHSRFDFIPGTETIVQDVSTLFDLVIALDCSDLRRVGHFAEMPGFDQQTVVNIDHHATNTAFGDVNLVDPQASSTAEVVLRLLEHLGVPIDAEMATCLLAGIVTDTRGFRTSNVTPDVMDAARRLMEAGASLPRIARYSLDHRPTVAIRLWGAALSDLQIEDGVIWTAIPATMRQAVGYKGNGDAGLSSFLVSADEAVVSVVFVERDDGRIEVGLRAVPGFDVAQLALRFGGGGHALAAGFNTAGPLDDAQDRVLNALRADVARQRESHA